MVVKAVGGKTSILFDIYQTTYMRNLYAQLAFSIYCSAQTLLIRDDIIAMTAKQAVDNALFQV